MIFFLRVELGNSCSATQLPRKMIEDVRGSRQPRGSAVSLGRGRRRHLAEDASMSRGETNKIFDPARSRRDHAQNCAREFGNAIAAARDQGQVGPRVEIMFDGQDRDLLWRASRAQLREISIALPAN